MVYLHCLCLPTAAVNVCINFSFSGIYFYNLHPIFKVDVLGTVVSKRERDDFFCYGGAVCDSTSKVFTQHKKVLWMDACTYMHVHMWGIVQQMHLGISSGPLGLTLSRLLLILSFFSTVDDGTGVINCLCWKNDLLKAHGKPSGCEFTKIINARKHCTTLH